MNGEKILLLYAPFFGYESAVKSKLLELGAQVDHFNPRCANSSIGKAMLKVFPGIMNQFAKVHHKRIIRSVAKNNYDIIFVNDRIPPNSLKKYKSSFPNAKMVLYCDDSVKNMKGINKVFSLFDKVVTFDLNDAKKYGINFHALFYIDSYKGDKKNYSKTEYEISFIGTCHSDRYRLIEKAKEYCSNKGKKGYFYCYLQSWFIFPLYWIIKKEFRSTRISDFAFSKLSGSEIADIIKNSNAVLDIEHRKQTGLTMRTIEMIGMHTKIITTNKSIKEYNFYNPSNVLIIDRDNPVFSDEFFNRPYVELPKDIYVQYSLENWIYDVLIR